MAACVRFMRVILLILQHMRFCVSPGLGAWSRSASKAFELSAPVLFLVLAVTAIHAQAKTPTPNIKDLIGMTNGSNANEYPLGWRKLNDCTYGRSLILCSMLKNEKQEGMILQKKSYQSKTIGESVPALITDAVALTRPDTYESLAFFCYPKQSDPNKTESFEIFAEVRFAKRCDVKTALIHRAWRMNLSTGKFEQISNTKDLVCEYGYRFRGEPEFRRGCPGYSPMPSK